MIENKEWYVVYTHPKKEKKVVDVLTRKGIKNYCPLTRSIKQWKDRKKVDFEPLFNSYVFVYIKAADIDTVLHTEGIINLVYWLGKPVVVRPAEIDSVRQFLNKYGVVKLEKGIVNLNDSVRIIEGPMIDQDGQIVSIKHISIKVLLPSLGYTMIVEVNKESVEPVLHGQLRHVS
jgi:transcription antitermination factor NusG